jgi:uncharacterized repeat protein (TIGR03803 family)
MRVKLTLVALVVVLASSAFAGTNPVPVYTFICNGNAFERIGNCPQGGRPGYVTLGSDGNFYGAAQDSSEGSSAPNGGTVFSLAAAGKFTLLHTFVPGTNKNYSNGNLPGLLTQGPDGKVYGTTLYGGNHGCNGYCGYGVLYRVNKNGSGFQILHKFCSQTNCADGSESVSGLKLGTDGNLYGTTSYGGTNNAGTIFRVTPSSGAYEVVLNFDYSTTGEDPSGLIVASDGTFYGQSFGTPGQLLFHYTEATGVLTTVAVDFPLVNGLPSSGGASIIGPNGNLYGIYGVYGESGAGLFEVEVDGSNLQLFPFYNTIDGGGTPQSMILASDGNFWVADYNGSSGYGDIISLSPTDGTLLQTFAPFSSTAAVGAYPAEVIQTSNGLLWGSTYQYGTASKGHFADGTVFSFDVGLPPR